MRYYLSLLLCLLFLSGYGQEFHTFSRLASSNTVVSPDVMTQRITIAAVTYAKYSPIPRFTEIDYAFGSSYEEFKNLGGYGIVYIPSLNREIAEYPIKRAYIRSNGKIVELTKLGEIKVSIGDNQTKITFGNNRVDYYYLLPYALTQKAGELLIDWSKNREEFVLTKFTDDNPLPFITDVSKINQKKPQADVLKAFLKREFNIIAD